MEVSLEALVRATGNGADVVTQATFQAGKFKDCFENTMSTTCCWVPFVQREARDRGYLLVWDSNGSADRLPVPLDPRQVMEQRWPTLI